MCISLRLRKHGVILASRAASRSGSGFRLLRALCVQKRITRLTCLLCESCPVKTLKMNTQEDVPMLRITCGLGKYTESIQKVITPSNAVAVSQYTFGLYLMVHTPPLGIQSIKMF